MKKEITHNKKEMCILCNKEINTSIDEWSTLIEYRGDNQTSIEFYHKFCFKDFITAKGEILRRNFEERLGGFAKKIMGNVNFNQSF